MLKRPRSSGKSHPHGLADAAEKPVLSSLPEGKDAGSACAEEGGVQARLSQRSSGTMSPWITMARDLKDHGLGGERVAVVVKNVYLKFRYIYPSETKDTESCIRTLLHFLKVEDKVGTIYSDSALGLVSAAKSLKARLVNLGHM